MNFGYFTSFKSIDKGLIENIGPSGFSFILTNISSNLVRFNNGLVFRSVLSLACSFLAFLSYYFIVLFQLTTINNFVFYLFIFCFFIIYLFEF